MHQRIPIIGCESTASDDESKGRYVDQAILPGGSIISAEPDIFLITENSNVYFYQDIPLSKRKEKIVQDVNSCMKFANLEVYFDSAALTSG
jgi:hypothetical protein